MPDHQVFHGTSIPAGDPDALAAFLALDIETFAQGFHVGSLAQARMRARGLVLAYALDLDGLSSRRVRDQVGSWARLCAAERRRGTAVLTYLNRYEGMTTARIEALGQERLARLDALSDARFRRSVPEAEDSHVVLDRRRLRFVGVVPGA